MLSVRRATVNYLIAGFDYWLFLSTPSVRRATLHLWPVLRSIRHFYPRPPRGGRPSSTVPCRVITSFLSTPSARRATLSFPTRPRFLSNFYPRPPRGGRLTPPADRDEGWKFLSTPSARRATCARCAAVSGGHISIHALREEGDRLLPWCRMLRTNFYPRPPRGGRQ